LESVVIRSQAQAFGLSALLMLAAPLCSAQSNLIGNGNFEGPDAVTISCYQNSVAGGWTSFGPPTNQGSCAVESGYSNAGLTWPVARDGTQFWYVNFQNVAGTKIAQNVTLAANTQYTLTFSLAGILGNATAPSVNVAFGNGVGSRNFTGTAGASWVDLAWTFTPTTSGVTTIAFTANSGPVNIDAAALQVTAVPELATGSMMVAGVAAMLGLAIRRRKIASP
jgi:hypothetical protein